MKRVCRVCELLDKDTTEKVTTYCKTCNQFICKPCDINLLRRGKAAIKEQYLRIK